MIYSKSTKVCARIESIAGHTYAAVLYTGITTDTRGIKCSRKKIKSRKQIAPITTQLVPKLNLLDVINKTSHGLIGGLEQKWLDVCLELIKVESDTLV